MFTEADIDGWRDALVERRPSPLGDVDDASLARIEGVALRASATGMVIRLRASDDSELTFAMNPVAARILAVAIIGQAQNAGWLDDRIQLVPSEA